MNKEIKNIFKNFIVDNENIDVAHLKYIGQSNKYVVWTITEETPDFCYDDEVQYSRVVVDIDIYSKGNYLNIIKEIKRIMKNNEWDWIEDSQEMYEDDTQLYHKTITFEKVRKI